MDIKLHDASFKEGARRENSFFEVFHACRAYGMINCWPMVSTLTFGMALAAAIVSIGTR